MGLPQPEDGSTGPSLAFTEAGFQGRITKAQIWGRALDTTLEIQKQVRDCRSEPVLYRSLVLNWAGYEITSGGVERHVSKKKFKNTYLKLKIFLRFHPRVARENVRLDIRDLNASN